VTPRHVILVGLPGAGKTTIARAVGARIGRDVVELDEEIERLAGTMAARIFATFGEAAFRRFEVEATRLLLDRRESGLVSAGGGWIANRRARELVPGDWPILYLRVSPGAAAARLGASAGSRPLLAGAARSPERLTHRLEELAAERAALYERADAVVDTESDSMAAVVDQVARMAEAWLSEREQ
jgi:shikimate kinase